MNPDGSNQTRLTDDPAVDRAPAWSPDGRIVFNSTRSGDGGIYSMDADGANVTRLTKKVAGHPAWSADGRYVAFIGTSLERIAGSFPPQIFLLDLDSSGLRMLTQSPTPTGSPCWGPDAATVAFIRAVDKIGGRTNIFQVDLDGRNIKRLTAGPRADQRPSFSPNGSKLAFQSNRDGNYEIYVMNLW